MNISNKLLELHNINCAYGEKQVVSTLSLTLREGEIGGLLGPSGCGKSTIFRAIAGFHRLAGGEIHLDGRVVESSTVSLPPEKRNIGMVFQDYALFPHLTVSENIAFGLRQLTPSARRARVADLLDLVQLHTVADSYPQALSGGQQQRVAVARALAPSPRLLLLDEPFSSLDAELRRRLGIDIRDILKRLGISAILVTHDQQEAFAMCDHVGIIHHGQIQQWDTPFNLYHEPVNRFVAGFVGEGCFIRGKMQSPTAILSEMGLIEGNRAYGWPALTEVDVLIRPDDIVLDRNSPLTAHINSKTFAGTSTLYRLRLGNGTVVEALFPSHQDFQLNDSIHIRVDAEHLIAFPR